MRPESQSAVSPARRFVEENGDRLIVYRQGFNGLFQLSEGQSQVEGGRSAIPLWNDWDSALAKCSSCTRCLPLRWPVALEKPIRHGRPAVTNEERLTHTSSSPDRHQRRLIGRQRVMDRFQLCAAADDVYGVFHIEGQKYARAR